MASVQTQTFSSFVGNAVTALQGAANALLDLTVGSVLRAFLEAVCGVAIYLQAAALQIASLTRFATSSGADADSWAADFGFTRLPAQSASGQVVFTSFTTTQQSQVPVGSIVQTQDGSEQYAVVADTTQTAYSASLNAYVIPSGVSSITATVNAIAAGSSGNATIGAINTLGSAIPGVDTVSNQAPFTNGADAETDQAFKIRFVGYIASLSKATLAAVKNAIASIQQDITYSVVENKDYTGTTDRGFFYAVIDDGTGNPPSSLISTASNAIDAVRPIGSSFGVFAPVDLTANVSMTITVASGYSSASVQTAVQNALAAYINALAVGQSLPYSRLAQIAYDVSPGITNVTAIRLNGSTGDMTATAQQVINAGVITVNVA